MTAMKAVGILIACACSVLLFLNAQRDRQRGAPWWVYVFAYAVSLVWAVAAYITATKVAA